MDEMNILVEEAESVVEDELIEELEDDAGELELLRAEVQRLRTELYEREELDRVNSRMKNEMAEFEEYFPETDISSVPDEIWEKVKGGASLASSFALYQRKIEMEAQRISDFNKRTRKMSAGSLASDEGEKYYSPSEVKKMSPAQVRANYDDIIESMRHWH